MTIQVSTWILCVVSVKNLRSASRKIKRSEHGKSWSDCLARLSEVSSCTVDDILWNWARWCWTGETVGNMAHYIPYDDTFRPICVEQAVVVDQIHRQLQREQQMVAIAEYPQRHTRFAKLDRKERSEKARRWIHGVTGRWLRDFEYREHLDGFKRAVEVELL